MPDQDSKQGRPGGDWAPHLWAVIVPFGAVVAAYALWFGFMALLRLPDWLARVFR